MTVQNIVDRADVGRSTFYSHFETKFDLLEAQLPVLGAVAESATLPDFLPLFEHVLEHGDAMRSILTQPVGREISDRMLQRQTEWWSQILISHHPHRSNNSLTASFLAGATVASMRHYLQDTSAATPRQMADSLEQLIRDSLGLEKNNLGPTG